MYSYLPAAWALLFLPIAGLFAQNYLTANDSVKISSYLQEASQKKTIRDWRGASDVINKAALTYWNAREFQKAIDLFHQSLALNRLIDNQSGIYGINNNLAFLHADLQQYDSSVYYFTKVLEGRRRQQVTEPIISALINLSVVYNKLKRFEESIKVLEEALEIARSQNNLERMRTCYGLLAETYEQMGNLQKTQEYFERYKEMVEILNKFQLSALQQELTKEQETRRRIEEARRLAEMEVRLQEEALNRAAQRLTAQDSAIALLTERYTKNQMALEILRKDSIIKVLTINQLLYEKRYRESRFYFYLLIVTAAFIIAILVIAFLYRLKENKVREARLLQLKNTQLAQQKEEIAQQAEQLSLLNQRLKQLFSIIGHDLRAPVVSLRGVLDLLLMNAISFEDFNQLMPTLHSNVTQLMVTLDNLLLWGKTEQEMQTDKVCLFQTVQETIDLLHLSAKQKNISLQNYIQNSVAVYFNRLALQTVLRNLINNAIKFTPEGGKITISAQIQENSCIVSIQDTGIGIPPEKLDHILQGGYSTKGTAGEGGTGIGIALCKNLCQRNKAQLKIKSIVNEGTTWYIHMPLAETPCTQMFS